MEYMEEYEYMFRWMKNASKEERHIEEVESFAKRHPILFWKFHSLSKDFIKSDEKSEMYSRSKDELKKLFNEHIEEFRLIFKAVKEKF